ncbi:RNA polymerase sigma factor [Streptomyces sp. NPDC058676]|uniref:RNA polymerase sigma factor n=1 Tax=unclassified Streptomyces TaxID=2593676 RepID=UPI0036690F2D
MRFVARRVDDPHTAADLTAEIFIAVLDSAHSYRPRLGSETAWLYGIARNVVSSERRRVAREAERDLRFAGRRLLEADDIARIEDKLDAESPGRRVLAALARLPEGERAVMELVAVDQLTVTEAAAVLGIRQVTARVRLHRARRRCARRQTFRPRRRIPRPRRQVPRERRRRTRRCRTSLEERHEHGDNVRGPPPGRVEEGDRAARGRRMPHRAG